MIYETTLLENRGSLRTTVPSALVNFLDLNRNKKARWILEVDDTGTPRVIVEFKDKSKE